MDELLKMFPIIRYEDLSSYRFDKKELISVTEKIDSSNDYFEQLIEKYKLNDDAVLISFSFNANKFPKLKNQKVVDVIYDDEAIKDSGSVPSYFQRSSRVFVYYYLPCDSKN
ncbi:hypothetical protein NHU85_11600 [Edwardsiella tarda]|uniref:hypothetical protein n=1 Tax=Edwardsiella tarda TaxID=636 RepID=UPI00267057DB|nr:hypothetical protein [Edwardsiella tarda]WKS80390.1 hypothetical protein NHU85_11600 [Edwardsiella tarda]